MTLSDRLTIVRVIVSGENPPPPGKSRPGIVSAREIHVVNPFFSVHGNHVESIQSLIGHIHTPLVALVHERASLPGAWTGNVLQAVECLDVNHPGWFALRVGFTRRHAPPTELVEDANAQSPEMSMFFAADSCVLHSESLAHLDPRFPSLSNPLGSIIVAARHHHRRMFVTALPGKGPTRQQTAFSLNRRATLVEASLGMDYAAHLQRNGYEKVVGNNPGKLDAADVRPTFLLARGGSGSRLLARLAQLADLDVGITNDSGDDLDLVSDVYRAVLCKWRFPYAGKLLATNALLMSSITRKIKSAPNPQRRVFKLPEMLLLPDTLAQLFPTARFVHMVRDPLHTCLRRPHMTARPDNQIGQTALAAAYDHCQRPRARIPEDCAVIRMAATTRHQLEITLNALSALPSDRVLEFRLESLVENPLETVNRFMDWWPNEQAVRRNQTDHAQKIATQLSKEIDPARLAPQLNEYDRELIDEATKILAPIRRRLGYFKH